MPAEARPRWTADEVRRELMDEARHWPRYELVDGELLVTPSPRMAHHRALEWLADRLKPYVLREQLGELARSPADLELEPGTIVQPDLFLIPREVATHAREWSDVTHLSLVIEVLSPGSARQDRGPKRELYQRAGVDEYWIVDLDSRLVERWTPSDERPEIVRERLTWHSAGAAAPLFLDLRELFDAPCPVEGDR
ncbi:MAG TPA: Uma2 family endonuclease [Gemmatimonadaceae bacterium]|nr:Uma2 family endonuclease [Gemmatimonadaceae bacterium]